VALNAEVKIGETLGMFRDAAADTVALALVDALREAASQRAPASAPVIEVVARQGELPPPSAPVSPAPPE
jgi:hypothetical protein